MKQLLLYPINNVVLHYHCYYLHLFILIYFYVFNYYYCCCHLPVSSFTANDSISCCENSKPLFQNKIRILKKITIFEDLNFFSLYFEHFGTNFWYSFSHVHWISVAKRLNGGISNTDGKITLVVVVVAVDLLSWFYLADLSRKQVSKFIFIFIIGQKVFEAGRNMVISYSLYVSSKEIKRQAIGRS